MSNPQSPRIAIIGAGMAGLACARELQRRGVAPLVLEKSRGLGGRLATRRTTAGDTFDHGAQYVTAQGESFGQLLAALQQQDAAAVWQPADPQRAQSPRHPWVIGTPGMNGLLKPLADGVELHKETTIKTLQRSRGGWYLRSDADADFGPFDAVVCTAPVVQARALLAVDPAFEQALEAVAMAPCWAVMLQFERPLPLAFDAMRYEQGTIAWLSRQASRPGRVGAAHGWVVHASPAWSEAHLEETLEHVLSLICHELAVRLGEPLPTMSYAAAHRWRYALTTQALGQPFLTNDDGTLYAAGDWCLGARVELAYESGTAAAQALIEKFSLA